MSKILNPNKMQKILLAAIISIGLVACVGGAQDSSSECSTEVVANDSTETKKECCSSEETKKECSSSEETEKECSSSEETKKECSSSKSDSTHSRVNGDS